VKECGNIFEIVRGNGQRRSLGYTIHYRSFCNASAPATPFL
jgi:hypothetical protein